MIEAPITFLRREFDRIAQRTDDAYQILSEAEAEDGGSPALEARYKDWATLLLRYHDALLRVTGKEPSGGLPRSMKGSAQASEEEETRPPTEEPSE